MGFRHGAEPNNRLLLNSRMLLRFRLRLNRVDHEVSSSVLWLNLVLDRFSKLVVQ